MKETKAAKSAVPPRQKGLAAAVRLALAQPTASGGLPKPIATRLYALRPRGLGTVEVESLTSYVRRLAAAHVVSPSALLRLEILEPHRVTQGQRHHALAPVLSFESINGAYKSSEILVAALERLTGESMRPTTMLGRDQAVCFDGAFRHVRAWCPECLRETDPYDRLMWAFTDIKTCLTHDVRLVDRCSNAACGKQHKPWHRAASAEQCPFCGAKLSSAASVKAAATTGETILRDLLALLLTDAPLSRDAIATGLVHLLAGSSWEQVSAFSGVSYATLCGIRRRGIRAQVDVLVDVIASSRESVADFLSHPATAITTRKLPKPTLGPGPQGKKLAYTAPTLEAELRAALKQPDGEIPSGRAFARAHRTTVDTLRRRWPVLIKALGRAFMAQEHGRRKRREAAEIDLLRDAVAAARASGDPSRRTVQKILGRPGLFRQKHVQLAYAEMLKAEPEGESRAA